MQQRVLLIILHEKKSCNVTVFFRNPAKKNGTFKWNYSNRTQEKCVLLLGIPEDLTCDLFVILY